MQNCCLLVMLRPFVIPNIEHQAPCWKCVGLNKVVWICVDWSWHWRGCILVTVKMEAKTLTCCDSPLSGWTGWMPVSSPEKLVYFPTQRMEQHSIPSVWMMGTVCGHHRHLSKIWFSSMHLLCAVLTWKSLQEGGRRSLACSKNPDFMLNHD